MGTPRALASFASRSGGKGARGAGQGADNGRSSGSMCTLQEPQPNSSPWRRALFSYFLIFSYFSFFLPSRLKQTSSPLMDHPNVPDDHHNIPPFPFYPPEHDQSYNLTYSSPLAPYQVMHHAANQPRGSLSLPHPPIRNSCSSDN